MKKFIAIFLVVFTAFLGFSFTIRADAPFLPAGWDPDDYDFWYYIPNSEAYIEFAEEEHPQFYGIDYLSLYTIHVYFNNGASVAGNATIRNKQIVSSSMPGLIFENRELKYQNNIIASFYNYSMGTSEEWECEALFGFVLNEDAPEPEIPSGWDPDDYDFWYYIKAGKVELNITENHELYGIDYLSLYTIHIYFSNEYTEQDEFQGNVIVNNKQIFYSTYPNCIFVNRTSHYSLAYDYGGGEGEIVEFYNYKICAANDYMCESWIGFILNEDDPEPEIPSGWDPDDYDFSFYVDINDPINLADYGLTCNNIYSDYVVHVHNPELIDAGESTIIFFQQEILSTNIYEYTFSKYENFWGLYGPEELMLSFNSNSNKISVQEHYGGCFVGFVLKEDDPEPEIPSGWDPEDYDFYYSISDSESPLNITENESELYETDYLSLYTIHVYFFDYDDVYKGNAIIENKQLISSTSDIIFIYKNGVWTLSYDVNSDIAYFRDDKINSAEDNGYKLLLGFNLNENIVQTFTVDFYVDQELYDSIEVVEGNKVTPPAAPIKEGHIFVGWYKDEEFTVSFKSNEIITDDINLFAKFTAQTSGGTSETPTTGVEQEIMKNIALIAVFSLAGLLLIGLFLSNKRKK